MRPVEWTKRLHPLVPALRPSGARRWRFTDWRHVDFGALTSHAESGEEIFEVRLDPTSGDVTCRIRAASRPRAPLARLGYPITRWLQAPFRRDSARAVRRAVGAGA